MENKPIRDPRFWEAIDSCRPGHQDQTDPDMADLRRELAESPELAKTRERLQKLDAALAHAFRDVPAPVGLESRILARLQAEAAEPSPPPPPAQGSVDRALEPSFPAGAITLTAISRRRWLVLGSSAAAAVAAAVVFLVFGLVGRHKEFAWPEVLDIAIGYHLKDETDRTAAPAISLIDYPLSPTLQDLLSGRFSQVRGRSVTGFLNRDAVAYDLLGPNGRVATVYVASCSVDGVPMEVPRHPMHSTGEVSVSAWQEGGLVYVLVVDGGTQAYERLFAPPSGPLA